MTPYHYRHQIVRWNHSGDRLAKYRFQIVEIATGSSPVHRVQWDFETFRGLLSFLSKHFPEIDVAAVQFQTAS